MGLGSGGESGCRTVEERRAEEGVANGLMQGV